MKTKYKSIPEVKDFGVVFAPVMVMADYLNGKWTNYQITEFRNIEISPALFGLHYGVSVFEGMKAHKSPNDEVVIFRIDKHFERFNNSAKRMLMPEVPKEIFIDGMINAISEIHDWVPKGFDKSLYIRPLLFATDPVVKIIFPKQFKFLILFSPSGYYYTQPVSLLIEEKYVRAVEGGTGNIKCAGNYGASLYPHYMATQKGYNQVIWTNAIFHDEIEEVGTMNIFFVIDDRVVTPSLDRGTILPGVTRDSIIAILKRENIKVEEKRMKVLEVIEAAENGRLREAFGSGTAATITQVASITYRDKKYDLPDLGEHSLANKLKKQLNEIKYNINVPEGFKQWLTIIKPNKI